MIKKYRKRMLILACLLLVTVLLAGVSYAVFNSYASQNSTNTLAATCIELEFSGEDSVNLTNAYPISDSEGLKTTPYKFKIKNKCKNYLEYMVIASVINVTNPLDSKYVKVNLSGDNEMNSVALSSLKSIQTPASLSGYSIKENYVLKENDGILKDEERNFEFRMWLDGENEEVWTSEQIENKNYQVKISVIGTVKTEPKDDLYIAALIDGKASTTFPTTKDYTATVNCTREGKKIDASESIKWNGTKWALTTTITDGNTRCNVEFIYKNSWDNPKDGTLLSAIKNGNTVTETLTQPGIEPSAHTLDDVQAQTASVSSTYQAYYITYGTGWEANGTGFNLTGTAVTSNTYANSYSTLVGKYLTGSHLSSAGSSTAGTMKTTINLSEIYYVVSATSSSFTYKRLSSNKNTIEALLASTSDDYGTSYYFRGAVTNNFVEYANMCWRIVRVTGDGSIKLVLYNYNGLTDSNNTPASSTPCNVTGNDYAFARYEGASYTSRFNSTDDDNTYVGFMYGTAGARSYADAHANTNPSTILTNLNKWYTNVLSKQTNFSESQLADTIWCNDKSVVTDTAFNPGNYKLGTSYGYGTKSNYYSVDKRLMQATSYKAGGTGPSLICPNDNNGGKLSKFTVSDTKYGNGALNGYAKIGLLTADEIAFVGGASNMSNPTNYLKGNTNSNWWWALSPDSFSSYAYVWGVSSNNGVLDSGLLAHNYEGVRPALSLNSGVKISSGIGTATKPYKVAA